MRVYKNSSACLFYYAISFELKMCAYWRKRARPQTIFTLAADGNELNISLLLIYNVLFAAQTEQPLRQIFIYTHCLLSAKCLLIRRPLHGKRDSLHKYEALPFKRSVVYRFFFFLPRSLLKWKKIESMYGQLTQMNHARSHINRTIQEKREKKKSKAK